MGLGALAARLAGVAASANAVTESATAAATAMDRVRAIDAARLGRVESGIAALLDGPATGAVMSMYLETLRNNPNDPALSQLKQFMRQFAKVDESVFTQLEAAARKLFREQQRNKSSRGKPIEQESFDSMMSSLMGQ